MTKQRRRWAAGAREANGLLPLGYRLLFELRNVTWGFALFAPLFPFFTFVFPDTIAHESAFLRLSLLLFLIPLVWSLVGYWYFDESPMIGALLLILTPIVSVVHSIGAFYGLVSRPNTFDITQKVTGDNQQAFRNEGLADPLEKVSAFQQEHAHRTKAFLVGTVLLGAAVRLYDLTDTSLWIDEIYSISARGSAPLVEMLFAAEAHPPLFYLLFKYWMGIFGKSVLAVRMFAVVIGVASIVAMYFLGRELFGRSGGIIAALLLSLSTFHVHISQFARMYGLFALLTILSLLYLVRVLRGTTRDARYLYILSTWLLLITHLFGTLVVLAQNVYYLFVYATRNDDPHVPSLRTWGIIQIVVGVIYLPFFGVIAPRLFLASSGGTGSKITWIAPPSPEKLLATARLFAGQALQYPIINGGPNVQLAVQIVLAVSVIALLALVATFRRDDWTITLDDRNLRPLVLILLLLLANVGLLYVLSFVVAPMYVFRYMVPGSIAFVLLVAGGLSNVRSDGLRVVLVGVLLVSSAFLVAAYHDTPTKEDWEGASEYVTGDLKQDDLIVLHPHWIDSSLDYYGLPTNVTRVNYTKTTAEITGSDVKDFQQRKTRHDTVWIVYRAPRVPHALIDVTRQTHSVAANRSFGDVVVYKFVRNGSNETEDRLRPILADRKPVSASAAPPPGGVKRPSRALGPFPAAPKATSSHVDTRGHSLHTDP